MGKRVEMEFLTHAQRDKDVYLEFPHFYFAAPLVLLGKRKIEAEKFNRRLSSEFGFFSFYIFSEVFLKQKGTLNQNLNIFK